jgi:hypothetical protein
MNKLTAGLKFAAALTLAGALSSPALAADHSDAATIHIHGGSVGFIAGVNWGSGTLHYRGHKYPLKVGGLSVGAIGASSYEANGVVLHLHHLSDIEGTYGAVEASATAGSGEGGIDMTNGKGVEIRARSSSSGLKLSAGPQGVEIQLKH